jgi:ABC-type sugar transport system permease subunit
VGVALWSFFGLGVLNYLSALSTIPGEIIEASRLDGAGFWRMLVQVVLPMIKPMVGYWTVLCASGVLIWMFPLIYALTRGGPGDATMLPEFLVFLTTFQFLDRGYGSAIGLALFLFVAVISVFTVRYMYNEGAKGKRP